MHKVVVHVGYAGWNSIVVYTKCTIDLQQIHTSPIMIRHKWYHSEWYCFVRFILTPAGVHSTKRHYCSQHIYDGHIIGVISLSFFIIFCSLCWIFGIAIRCCHLLIGFRTNNSFTRTSAIFVDKVMENQLFGPQPSP